MAAVYQDILIEWGGVEYTIRPTMRLMQDIEQRFSLSRVANRITQGDVPLSHMAAMVAMMLRSAGASVSEDEVFAELLTGDEDSVRSVATALIVAAFPIAPKVQESGNDKAPATAKPNRKK